jgi:hypothetical protein
MAHTTRERRNRHQGSVALKNRTEFCADTRLRSGQRAPVHARGRGITQDWPHTQATGSRTKVKTWVRMLKQIRTQERKTQNQLGNTKFAAHSSKPNTETEGKQRFNRGKDDQKNQPRRTWKSRPAPARDEKFDEKGADLAARAMTRTKNLRTRQFLDPVNIKKSTSSTNERQNGFFHWFGTKSI